MNDTLQHRLDAARHEQFVGRADHLSRFREVLLAPELPVHVVYVCGPGGIGKTALLREFAEVARSAGVPALVVDGRDIEPAPEAFRSAVERGFQGAEGRRALVVDTYEALRALDGWLRRTLLPEADADLLIVLAERNPPDPAWWTDLGWGQEVERIALRNLGEAESRSFLANAGVPASHHDTLVGFTRGHPLALTLAAAEVARRPDEPFEPTGPSEIIRTLMERFVDDLPSAEQRVAIDAVALARSVNEPVLSAAFGGPSPEVDVRALFGWLGALPVVEQGRRGLSLHELARDVIAADLRWRDPERYALLHGRLRGYYTRRLQAAPTEEAQRDVLGEIVFLYRDNPVVQPLLGPLYDAWRATGELAAGPLQPDDVPALRAAVARHEGGAAAEIAERWMRRVPEGCEVYRAQDGGPRGFLYTLDLTRTDPGLVASDPVAHRVRQLVDRYAPVRADGRALLFRFWMDVEAHQGVSAVQCLVFARTVYRYLATPGLAASAILCTDPEFWGPAMTFAGLQEWSDADADMGPAQYGVFGMDWRTTSPDQWLEAVTGQSPLAAPTPSDRRSEGLAVLNREDFDAAVRRALRDLDRPTGLLDNPLLHTRLVVHRAGPGATDADRAGALRGLVRDAAEALATSPRDARYHRALQVTYLKPAPSQAVAAERLGLPFSTFRRHLQRGIDHVAEALWRIETAL